MRISVFGAGAVGGQLGARLIRSGVPVSLIARGQHLAAMRAHGLTLVEGTQQWNCHPFCTDTPAEIGEQDVVIVAVKSTALPSVAAQIAPLMGQDTEVVFAMNGMPWWFLDGLACPASQPLSDALDPNDGLRNAVGLRGTVGCSINSGSEIIAPGVVRSDTPERNRITLGKPDGSEPQALKEFAALTARAGYPTTVTTRIRDAMWPKLMTHSCRPPICALTEMSTRELAHDTELLAIARQMLMELTALGTRLELSFSFDLDQELARKPHGDHVSSLVQDIKAGRRPEAASGILAMRSVARAVGMATPVLDVISTLLAGRVASLRAPTNCG